HHADDLRPVSQCRGTKEGIDSRTMTVFFWPGDDAHHTALHQQMPVRWCDVYLATADAVAVMRMDDGKPPSAFQYLRQQAGTFRCEVKDDKERSREVFRKAANESLQG